MPSFVRVNPGDPMQANQLNQVIDALTGAVGKGVPLAPTAVNDATNYALTIQNDDATNSRALSVLKQDGTSLIQADKNGVVLALANASVPNAALGPDVARDNLLTNPGFEIWQRGTGPFTTTGGLTADRWINASAGTDVLSVSKDTTNQDTAGSLACAAVTFTLGTGGGNSIFYQRPTSGDGYQLRNRVVTFSIRIKTSTASAVRIAGYNGTAYQFSSFHSGNGTYQTISITWTMGAAATLMNVGVFFAATCVAYLDNAMLVIGAQAADFVPLHPADDLARCLRYYEVVGTAAGGDFIIRGWAGAASQAIDTNAVCRVLKTVTPTVTKVGTWNVQNCAQPTANAAAVTGFRAEVISTAAGADTFSLNQNAGCFFTMESNP